MPPGLYYEFFYEDNNTIESNGLKKYELVKHFNNHTFIKIMLNGRNQQWQKELFEMIQKENVSITFDETNLIGLEVDFQKLTKSRFSQS